MTPDYAKTWVMKDGIEVRTRPIRPEDEPEMALPSDSVRRERPFPVLSSDPPGPARGARAACPDLLDRFRPRDRARRRMDRSADRVPGNYRRRKTSQVR